MNDLVAGGSANRDLARFAMSLTWDCDQAIKDHGPLDIAATRIELESRLHPLKAIEPGCIGENSTKVRNSIKMIGMKVRPEMSTDQCKLWIDAVLVALSDLPPHVVTRAASEAIHSTFEFLTQVEAKIREIGDAKVANIRLALRRLDAMAREIERSMIQQPRLEDANDGRLSTPEVHELQRAGQKEIIRMGLKLGSITDDQLLAEPDDDTHEGGDEHAQ